MKILHVETGKNLYGGALQVLYLLRGLNAGQCRNILVCTRGAAIAEAAVESAKVYEIPMAGELDFRFLFRLLRIIRTETPDIIHIHSRRGADLWGALAAMRVPIPVILTRRVDNPERPWVARLKYRPFHQIVTISNGIRKVLISEGIAEKRTVCVHSAVDTDRYRPGCGKARFCSEFGVDSATKTVGIIAQLIARKGHRFLISAIPEILNRCPQAHFIFFGKGPLQEQLRQNCRAAGIHRKVSFAGFREDLDRILPCLDLVVHPATMEGLGVSLLQASSCGVPIVASNAGGIPEIVRHNINGYLIHPEDVNAIITYVSRLLCEPETAERLGSAGRDIVLSEFSIAAMVAGNLEIYFRILSKRIRQSNV